MTVLVRILFQVAPPTFIRAAISSPKSRSLDLFFTRLLMSHFTPTSKNPNLKNIETRTFVLPGSRQLMRLDQDATASRYFFFKKKISTDTDSVECNPTAESCTNKRPAIFLVRSVVFTILISYTESPIQATTCQFLN